MLPMTCGGLRLTIVRKCYLAKLRKVTKPSSTEKQAKSVAEAPAKYGRNSEDLTIPDSLRVQDFPKEARGSSCLDKAQMPSFRIRPTKMNEGSTNRNVVSL